MKKYFAALTAFILLSFSLTGAELTKNAAQELIKFAPESVDYTVLFSADCFTGNDNSGKKYLENHSGTLAKAELEKIGYYLRLERQDGGIEQVFVTMDPFLEKISDYSFPRFWPVFSPIQKKIKNMTVKSNVPGVKNGTFSEGNAEIWLLAVSPKNSAGIKGADDSKHDFGDTPEPGHYGVFQIHNTKEKQTVFAVNHWFPGKNTEVDVGIGNAPDGEPDWTFSKSGKNYKSAILLILIKMK